MLRDATMYRQSKASLYQPTPAGDYEPQYIPWTTTTGLRGTRVLLTKQVCHLGAGGAGAFSVGFPYIMEIKLGNGKRVGKVREWGKGSGRSGNGGKGWQSQGN